MIAANVDRELVARVGREGWAAIPADARAGLSDPAPASAAYKRYLAKVFLEKQALRHGRISKSSTAEDDGAEREPAPSEVDAVLVSEAFRRFVEAQLTWDRALAEALATALRSRPGSLAVGIMGRGHVQNGYGVPHQLADLGVSDTSVVLPVEASEACEGLPTGLADAVFVVAPAERASVDQPRPRLGIQIEGTDGGVRVLDVVKGSVAESAGLRAGDVVTNAAGVPVAKTDRLIEIVQRQAPGTWLPLEISRDGEILSLVAKFPTRFD